MRATPSQRLRDKHKPSNSKQVGRGQSFGRRVQKLCCCCVKTHHMREVPEPAPPLNMRDSSDFDNVFTQLGPDDVSYKVRTQPKMVHRYIVGDVLGEGMIVCLWSDASSITTRRLIC
jgi:hypothetical protein